MDGIVDRIKIRNSSPMNSPVSNEEGSNEESSRGEGIGDAASPEIFRRASSTQCVVVGLAPAMAASLRRVLGSEDPDYEDVLQSALERVFTTLGTNSFRGECSLAGWASIIARNVAIDALRARSRERGVLSLDENVADVLRRPSGDAGPERLASARQQLKLLDEALAALRPSCAIVLYLHDVVGHDLAEIAETLSISVSAAQSRLVRGRREVVEGIGSRPLADVRAKAGTAKSG